MSENIVYIHNYKNSNNTNDNSSGGGGGSMDLEKRVERLENSVEKLRESNSRIELAIARLEGKLDLKANATDVAEIKGKLSQIPNFWQQLAISIAVAGFMMAALRFGFK